MGFKIGYIPPNLDLTFLQGLVMDYLLVGADVRFQILKGALIVPEVSVGGGFSYQYGSLDIPGVLGGSQNILNVGPSGWVLSMSDPSLNFNWKTFVIDAKAQASWDLLFLTPYVGVGASYAPYSWAGGGMKSQIQIGGSNITQAQIDTIAAAYGENINVTGTEFITFAKTPAAWSIRAFGGFSINLLMVKLDLLALYNIVGNSFGASLNLRVQL
jgi:hypothetical protein